jgi:hypothetical protein
VAVDVDAIETFRRADAEDRLPEEPIELGPTRSSGLAFFHNVGGREDGRYTCDRIGDASVLLSTSSLLDARALSFPRLSSSLDSPLSFPTLDDSSAGCEVALAEDDPADWPKTCEPTGSLGAPEAFRSTLRGVLLFASSSLADSESSEEDQLVFLTRSPLDSLSLGLGLIGRTKLE